MPDQTIHHVPCRWKRPGNPAKSHCIGEVLTGEYRGIDVFLHIPGQMHFKNAGDQTIIMAKNRFSLRNEWQADASPDYIQKELASKYQYLIKPEQLRMQAEEQVPAQKKSSANFTYKIPEIELRDPENGEVFDRCVKFYGTKKEAGRRLIAFAIACMKEAKEFDLPNAC